ncbi:hypothetical protein CDD80_6468 [Ophiocordyceps camponoti-rufipedis]|uniref:Uncharacterized protein n=1 Tax=Ophiocordyceps camponoti-rufipedis TaxID=2004952 RepID=A0A2C5YQM5_9HYPO|nr:hypothetical protein CDD80_6468 [Ophiocordyceps camponoti-rufipedis]
MDAQNAAESDHSRPAGASPTQQPPPPPPPRPPPSPPPPPSVPPPPPPPPGPDLDSRPQPPISLKPTDPPPSDAPSSSSSARPPPDDNDHDRDSDAETIVLPGKDGHSPSKARKVRQEDRSESDGDAPKPRPRPADALDKPAPAALTSSLAPAGNADPAGKKRLPSLDKDRHARLKDGGSSGLSSAPASPSANQPQHHHPPQQQHQHPLHRQRSPQHHHPQHHHNHQHPYHHSQQPRRRRSDAAAASSPSDSENLKHRRSSSSNKASLRDKLKPGDRDRLAVPHKRKAPRIESDDETDHHRKARRQRTASVHLDGPRLPKEARSTPAKPPHDTRPRSISPPPARQHRRSISTQLPLPSPNGLNLKKKRLPPPLLQPTDYQSDDSSAGDTALPRTSKSRNPATPAALDANTSPAKMIPHKKHLDAHGQTLLARACARGEYETAKQRLQERPEDLNVADYAGNTPLQIAAINGCEDIVKLLIDAGCNLDCVNYDKDTPLLDAVDNGHLGVVNLLLDAGVNPRKANVNGEEPFDRVGDDTNNADEIRAVLLAARKRAGERRRTSEDRHDSHDSHAPDSPRRSPPLAAATGRRSGTVRSTKTRNDLLYMSLDDKTLRQAAGRGDKETVARILQVKEGHDDPESMVAAARGGHDLVIQLLLGLGGANADPGPVPSLPSEFATPMLAAIGQENIKVIELLLEQQGFDPTRKFKGETYYEIARRRQGTNWKEEEQMLKNSYDEYRRFHRDAVKTKSPVGRRERDRERDDKPPRRDEHKDSSSKPPKRHASSPSRELDARKKPSTASGTIRDKKRPDLPPSSRRGEDETHKRAPSRVKKDSSHVSDRENSPVLHQKPLKTKRNESDLTGLSSEGEAAKPRRKLVSKGELSRERDRQKRAHKEPSSPRDPKTDEAPADKSKALDKYHDRARALKRDLSRDHSPGEGATSKRHRTSVSPDRPSDGDREQIHIEAPAKRRRLDGEASSDKRSMDGRPRKSGQSRDASRMLAEGKKDRDDGYKDSHDQRTSLQHGSTRVGSVVHVKSEDVDMPMPGAKQSSDIDLHDAPPTAAEQSATENARKKDSAEQEAKREAERKRSEAEEKKRLEDEDKKKKHEEAERKKKLEEADKKKKLEEAERKKKLEEAERKKKLEEAERKKKLEEAERKKKLEEAERKKKLEEAERKKKQQEEEEKRKREEEKARKAEEERKRREEDEARKRREQADRERREAEEAARLQEEERRRVEEQKKREEEEQRRREEEERLRKEQLEREAAEEAARRQREEEERRERAHREELERKRAAREAEQKRIREEQERIRLDKLPPLLRWLDLCPNPKMPAYADKFKQMLGPRYDTISPGHDGTAAGREQWVLNLHVALLLGEKDLNLSRYTAWERTPVNSLSKMSMWRTEWLFWILKKEELWDLGRQIPGYYEKDPSLLGHYGFERLKDEAWPRFRDMDMFFVKVSDLMYTVPNIPHLRNIRLAVAYREFQEHEGQGIRPYFKHRKDPNMERYFGFSPRNRYYVNGVFTGEDLPMDVQTSKTPFPEVRVPRRGLVRVYPGEPDYEEICRKQGLEHLINKEPATPALPNGVHSSPGSQTTTMTNTTTTTTTMTPAKAPLVNGTSGHSADEAATTNGVTMEGTEGP